MHGKEDTDSWPRVLMGTKVLPSSWESSNQATAGVPIHHHHPTPSALHPPALCLVRIYWTDSFRTLGHVLYD